MGNIALYLNSGHDFKNYAGDAVKIVEVEYPKHKPSQVQIHVDKCSAMYLLLVVLPLLQGLLLLFFVCLF